MSTATPTHPPFRMTPSAADPLRRSLQWAARPAVERALALPALNNIYAQIQGWVGDERHFADKALDALGVRYRVREDELALIPKQGPLVVVANHPFGGIEGMVLCSLLRRVRPDDTKLLANYLLAAIPELRDTFFFVDPFGTPAAAKRNLASMRGAIDHVKAGGCLGVFPAGEVSHLKLRRRTIDDPPWSKTVGKIVQRTGATVVPVFFHGRNSALFQIAGLLHPRLRTAMLPREMLKKKRGRIRLRIGNPLPDKRVASFADPEALTSYLRVRTYVLKPERWRDRRADDAPAAAGQQPVIDPLPRELLVDELAALPAEHKLLSSRDMDVYIAPMDRLPNMIREIGRVREVAFRKVGEGTGKPLDLDRFDQTYQHLIVWDRAQHQVVGAYRLGQTDRILPRHGVEGLYTATLFHFKRKLLEQINPALELGRSFVHPDYQRSFAPLMLLWQGIGHYVVREPRYRHLFGTVSISADYTSMTKQLLMSFLEAHNNALPKIAKLAKAKNPPRRRPPRGWEAQEFSTTVRDVGEVNELIADLEADGKHMPVLLRQYLKLNGKLLGFNIDPDFGNVLDGLMLFDITEIPRPILRKYLTKEGAASFLAYHGVQAEATPLAQAEA